MKKLLILLAAILFGVTATYAQAWTVDISWDDTQCSSCTSGYFEIRIQIYDNANEEYVYQNLIVSNIPLTEDEKNVPVPLVEDHCDDLSLTYAPDYDIYVGVYLKCEDSFPPQTTCSGTEYEDSNCYEFNQGAVPVDEVILD